MAYFKSLKILRTKKIVIHISLVISLVSTSLLSTIIIIPFFTVKKFNMVAV